MNKCPLTYELCENTYSVAGLQKLSPHLTNLAPLPFDSAGLIREAALRSGKMSIQGMQPKLSLNLVTKNSCFEIVDTHGRYILKPQSTFPELPENEDLTMRLAKISGIEVPLHGLIYARDNSLNYFIKRFDRVGRSKKIPLEDFAQLAGRTRDTKYDFSMERLVPIIEKHCTFPVIEKQQLFIRVLFNFLVGNEGMHLKNYSLITRANITTLAPAYDFLNTTIVLRDPVEIALPLNGKQRNLTFKLLTHYWGQERLGLPQGIVDEVMTRFTQRMPQWFSWIEKSLLSAKMKIAYSDLVRQRLQVLGAVVD